MIEEKSLAVNWCKGLIDSKSECTLPPIGYQFILWNHTKDYQTQSFDWVTLNTHLRASLDNRSFTDQLIDIIQAVQTYADILKLIKNEDELLEFQQFTNIIPFQKHSGAHF